MEIIVYVNKEGKLEGVCSFKAIDLCVRDEKDLLIMLEQSYDRGRPFKSVHVLTEREYQSLIKYRDTHPDYIKYKESKDNVKKFEDFYIM